MIQDKAIELLDLDGDIMESPSYLNDKMQNKIHQESEFIDNKELEHAIVEANSIKQDNTLNNTDINELNTNIVSIKQYNNSLKIGKRIEDLQRKIGVFQKNKQLSQVGKVIEFDNVEYICFKIIKDEDDVYVYLVTKNKPMKVKFVKEIIEDGETKLVALNNSYDKDRALKLLRITKEDE